MKKLIFSAAVLASAFFAASCQQEMLDPQAEGTTVTYTVEVPDAIATKATGDGFTLHYEVYRQGNLSNLDADPIYAGTKEFSGGKADVQLEFVKDQEFTVLFWAQQTTGAQAYNITDLRAVSLNTLVANDTTAEVFAGNDHVSDCKSDKDGNVVLVRPVAQLNIATTAESFTLGTTGSTEATVVPTQSKVVVNGLYGTYNVADGTVGTKASRTYTEANVPGSDFKSTYKLMATNYLGFIPQAGDNVEVTFTIYTENDGNIEHTVSNVPVKANYQTNILGNLISATADYQVTLEDWADAGKDMEVLADGIVKNINGDYEISTAVGFAYAINKLFADGGTFYIHPGSYNFTGLVVVPQPTKPGAILNVKANEVPVVTRSTPGFEIIGLDVAYLVSEVTDGSQAIFSNLVLPDDTKLVGTNNGVVGIANCVNGDQETGAALIDDNTNGKFVSTDSMASVDEIKAAMEQDLKLIELTGDMSLDETLVISKDVTLDGCGHKLTSTAARAINVSGAEANGVTIKNLVIECTGERAINIIQNATNVIIDNVTATASNYTVNVATSAPGAVVNIVNSTLNGLCTVNVASPEAVVTVDNSTINCNDNNTTVGEAYAAIGLNKDAVRGQIIVRNSTINVTEGSDSVKARNGAEDGSITIDGSEEEVTVQVAAITFEDSDYYYSFTSLEDAIASAQKYNRPVTLIRNLNVAETITIEEGQTVVLDLNGKTLTAGEDGYAITNMGELKIKNNGVINGVVYAEGAATKTIIDGGTYNALENAKYVLLNSQGASLTINAATINGGSSYPIYSYDANSKLVINDATVNATFGCVNSYGTNGSVEIYGGTFKMTGVQGKTSHIAYFSQNCTANINGGTFEKIGNISMSATGGGGICVNGGAVLTINGGSFAGDYDDVYNYGGSISVKGGTYKFKPDFLHDDYKAVQNAYGKWEVVGETYVAQIGKEMYESLQEAVDVVENGGIITLIDNVTVSETSDPNGNVVYYTGDKSFELDLNGKKLSGNTSNVVFRFQKAEGKENTITIKNGTVEALENCWGAISIGSSASTKTNVNLVDLTVKSQKANDMAVRARTGAEFTMTNCSVIAANSAGGICAGGGNVTLNNVTVNQTGWYSNNWNSVALGISGGAKMTVNSGSYTSNPNGDTRGTWVAYVMTSGGILEINGGSFNGTVGQTANSANACGLICADAKAVVNINGGEFNSTGAILDMRNNTGGTNPQAVLAGGNFSADPRISGLYSSNLIKVAEGKEVVEGAGRWTIQ